MEPSQPLLHQSLPHSFPCNGGWRSSFALFYRCPFCLRALCASSSVLSVLIPLQICTFVFNSFQDAPAATPLFSNFCIVARGWVYPPDPLDDTGRFERAQRKKPGVEPGSLSNEQTIFRSEAVADAARDAQV